MSRSAFAAFVLSAVTALAVRGGVAYETSKHGHPETGVQRLAEEGIGACGQCHDKHASRDGVPNGGPFERLLFKVDDETLCYECHSGESANRVYPDNVHWADSTHAAVVLWPGPTPKSRPPSDVGKCINCHDPHATSDANGVIPSMLRLRERSLCLGCHDGGAAKDVKAQLARAYAHPADVNARHDAREGNDPSPSRYGSTRRHAECADCHNPHLARADFGPVVAPEASQRLYGVSRVAVVNGGAGTQPLYVWKSAADLIDPREYEVCFKCHSSWTTLPGGAEDLAVVTNPKNPSYHPIQARGKNTIDAGAFEAGMTWDATIYCTDCHGSDDASVRGPHGSNNRHILELTAPNLCYSCHRFGVYGDPLATDATQSLSRFGKRTNGGHAYHVGEQRLACDTCHVTHGSTERPALLVTGRTPGLVLYTQNAGGGTCTPTCHATKTYTVNYGR